MKRLIITLSMIMFVIMGYAQVTNVAEFRVADATKEFKVNLPVGSKVYDVLNDKYYVVTTGLIANSTLNDAIAAGYVTLLNDTGTDDQTAAEVSVSATGNISSTNVQAALEELQGDIDGISVTDDQTLSIDSVGRVFTLSIDRGNSVSFEDTDTQLTETEVDNYVSNNGYLTTEIQTATDVAITDTDDDYATNTVEAALVQIGDSLAAFSAGISNISDTDDQTLDLTSNTLSIEDGNSVDLSAYLDNTDNQDASEVSIADAGNIITATDVEGALQENRTAIDLNASNISTNTSDISTNASQITTNAGNISTNTTDIAALQAIAKTVTTTIDITSTPSYIHSLTGLVETAGCVVAINGAVIEPNKYTLTAGQIEINSSLTTLYEFDQLVVTYKTALP